MGLDKLVDSSQLDTDLASVANAIRTKGGTSAQLAFPEGFVSAVQAIPTGTTPTGTKQISITANGTTTEDVTNYASAEITVNVPSGGGGLTVDDIVARNISGPLHLTATNAVQSPVSGLFAMTQITELLAEGSSSYRDYAFANCTKLTKAVLTAETTGSSSEFSGCTALTVIVSWKGSSIWGSYAAGCSKLRAVDFGAKMTANGAGFRAASAFSNCTVLKTVILRYPGVFPLSNINNFANTPFASGKSGGTLYVPQNLIASYQAATNWSTILGYANNQILPIEGSIYETQYVDGTPIT